MYLFYTNEYRRGRKHSRELLAKSIAMLTEQLANAESTADSSSPEDSSEICLSKELYCMSQEELLIYIEKNIGENQNGKPCIAGVPDYSISHSENTWAIAFADVPCGLDIQYNRAAKLMSIAERFYAEEELLYVKRLNARKEDEFFRIWARHEAVIKAAGGTVFDEGSSTLNYEVVYCGGIWRLYDVDFGCRGNEPVPKAAVAVRGDSALRNVNDVNLIRL